MAEYELNVRLLPCAHTAAEWASSTYKDKILKANEIGYEKDTGRYKVGDGETKWASLPWAAAEKLSSNAGSATQPVYFSGGKPVACTYSLNKTVPADAKFTDTNTWRGIQNNLTSTSTTESLSAAQGKILNEKFANYLAVGGTAVAAKKLVSAVTLSSYAFTPSTYIADGEVVGLWNNNSSTDTNGYPVANTSGGILFGRTNAAVVMAARAGQTVPTIYVKQYYQSWGDWALLLHSGNYTSYTVKKDGTGATGTWGISITGNAKTATSATKATNDSKDQAITSYIRSLSISGTTITYTKGDGTTGTLTTQDNNTNNKVTQTNTTGSANYRVLFSATADDTTRTEGARKSAKLLFNPSTGVLTATTFNGALSGNASTATNADKLDGYHANNIYNGFKHTIANANTTNTHVCIATITIGGTSLSMAGFTAIFSNRECLDNSSFILTLALRRNSTSASGTGYEFYYTPIQGSAPREIFIRSDDGVTFKVYFTSAASQWTTYYNVTPLMTEGTVSFSSTGVTSSGILSGTVLKASASIGGVVKSAETLTTARNINGTSFNGSADITTANWGTARTLTIGNTGKSVNGSAAVSWSLAEIGAAPASGSNNYVRVYNSNNVGQSSTVTVNDLAKQHAAVAMIYAATDNPTGASKWVHVWNQSWSNGTNTSWVSQIALGVNNSNGMWYRTTQGTIVGAAWKRVLDSSNFSSYALPLAGGTMNAGASIIMPEKSGSLGTAHIKIYDNSNYGLRMDAEAIQIWSGAADIADATSFSEIFSGYIYTSGYLQAGTTLTVGSNAYFKAASNYFYNGSYYTIINRPSASANYTLYLPSATGQLVYHTNDTAIGGTAKPVYIAASGAATACSSTVGSTSKPVYMNAGTITALSATVGSSSRPMYSNAGTLTAITSVAVAYGGTGATTAAGARGNLGAMAAISANGYYGMGDPSGATNVWIRTTSKGIIPYQSGSAGSGHGSLGASSWYFSAAYIDNIYGYFNGNLSGTAAYASRLVLPRVTADVSYQPGNGIYEVKEFSNTSTNLPSAHWYHVFTGQGSDANYNTQLALGMTTEQIHYRYRSGGTWGSWHRVYTSNYHPLADTAYALFVKSSNTITSTTNDTTAKWGAYNTSIHWYTKTGQLTDQPSQYGYILNVGTGSEVHQIWMTQSSGNMLHRGGNASGWNGSWRILFDTSNYTSYVVPKTGGTFTGAVTISGSNALNVGTQLKMWSDGEGGNIRLFTKTSTTNCFEFDGYDGNLRLYYSTNGGGSASASWSWKTNGLFMSPYIGVNGNNTSYRLYVVGTSYLSSTVTSAGEFISTTANGFRITQGNYGAFFRNDGSAFYLLFTASGSQTGSWNSLRPFTANLSNGYVTIGNGLGVGAANTGYTFNVTGTSRFSGKMTLFGSVNASNANAPFNGAIEIREAGLVTTSQSAITYAPKIGFHWGGRVASALALHSDNYFYRVSNNGTAYKIVDKACFSLSGTTLTITV